MTAPAQVSHRDISIGDLDDEALDAVRNAVVPKKDRAMLAWMDGLITAAIIGPVEVGMDDLMHRLPMALDAAEAGMTGAMRSILELRRGQLRILVKELKEDFEPDFLETAESPEEELEFAREWANGFRTAMNVPPGAWQAMTENAEAFDDFASIGRLMLQPEDGENPRNFDAKCRDEIPFIGKSLWKLRQFWRRQSPNNAAGRSLAKLARNSICPCGSGKKFKRCCMN